MRIMRSRAKNGIFAGSLTKKCMEEKLFEESMLDWAEGPRMACGTPSWDFTAKCTG